MREVKVRGGNQRMWSIPFNDRSLALRVRNIRIIMKTLKTYKNIIVISFKY